jgi:cullin-4
MIERLLKLKAQLDEVLSRAFASSLAFSDYLTSAFQSAINSRTNKPAELLAKFIDAKLRGSKGVSEGDLEATLDKALVLFGYIQVNSSSWPVSNNHVSRSAVSVFLCREPCCSE